MGLVLGLTLAAAPAGVRAQATAGPSPEQRLRAVEREMESARDRQKALDDKAAALAVEVESLRADLVAAARQVQETEEDLSALETRLGELKQREADLNATLAAQGRRLRAVLTGLERLALRPPEALLVLPAPPEDSVRAALLLRSVTPAVQEKVAGLRRELADLAAVRQEIAARHTEVAVAAAGLDRQHRHLADLFARKATLHKAATVESAAAARRAADLARDAQTLRDLMARLEEERRKREAEARRQAEEAARRRTAAAEEDARRQAAGPASAGKRPLPPPADGGAGDGTGEALAERPGGRPLPARGRILIRYGEAGSDGLTHRGLSVRTRPGAQVVAPAEGLVAFAGPFRGYGLLLILEHPGGYHTLLSGLGRLDAEAGDSVLAGEPVGAMDVGDTPTLYLELRRDGQPINPLPWLTARKG